MRRALALSMTALSASDARAAASSSSIRPIAPEQRDCGTNDRLHVGQGGADDVIGADPGGDRRFHQKGIVGVDKHHDRARLLLRNLPDRVQPVRVRPGHIDDDHIGRGGRYRLDQRRVAGCADHLHIRQPAQAELDRGHQIAVRANQQYAQRHGRRGATTMPTRRGDAQGNRI